VCRSSAWSVEALGGDLQDAVAANCSHSIHPTLLAIVVPVEIYPYSLLQFGIDIAAAAMLRLISPQQDAVGFAVNGFGKDR
jgi:hypothetical protein